MEAELGHSLTNSLIDGNTGLQDQGKDQGEDTHTGQEMVVDINAGKPLHGWAQTLWDKMVSQEDSG